MDALDVVEVLGMMGQAKAIAAAVALGAAVTLAATWHAGRIKAAEQAVHAHYAVVLADILDKTAAAQAAFRQRETAWQTSFDKEARNGQTRIDAARRDAAGARSERDGLRADLDRYRAAARAASDTCAATAGETTGAAVDLLAELFSRADEAAGELAQALDIAHAAGITCERAADSLIAP